VDVVVGMSSLLGEVAECTNGVVRMVVVVVAIMAEEEIGLGKREWSVE